MKKDYGTYLWILLLALPAILWAAFEMYWLTLGGSQMLFYSVTHAHPVIAGVVLLSLPFFVITVIYSALLLLNNSIAIQPIPVVALVLLVQLAHTAALFTYEQWSRSEFRVAICVSGLTVILLTVLYSFVGFKTYNQSLKHDARKARAP